MAVLLKNVSRIWVGECSMCFHFQSDVLCYSNLTLFYSLGLPTLAVPLSHVSCRIHVYQPNASSHPTSFTLAALAGTNASNFNSDDDVEDEDADVSAATMLHLPSMSLEGLWDNLIYEGDVKSRLLGYIHSTMLFGDSGVDFNVVSWNRSVALPCANSFILRMLIPFLSRDTVWCFSMDLLELGRRHCVVLLRKSCPSGFPNGLSSSSLSRP